MISSEESVKGNVGIAAQQTSKAAAQKRKPLAINGERQNSVDVIIVCANDTCAGFLAASVISLQKVDTIIPRHGGTATQVGE
ncbi:hypothetical protein [Paraburkholderia sp. GAS82]|uniref:hypothetical protein n=1 Tax=Paraburkholderia sp. GAS82 TaxID=3035137 RepID=UPI003D1F9AA9